jgi:hypothetical protein
MMRCAALRQVGGFREDLIAGEEPELCARVREHGWTIHRIDAEMAVHDAAMTRFGQWWRRSVRAGYAWAQATRLHGLGGYGGRPVASALAWGVALPGGALALAPSSGGWSLLALLAYPAQWVRITVREMGRGRSAGLAWRSAGLLLVAKFAHAAGIVRFALGAVSRRPSRIIEYKGPETPDFSGMRAAEHAMGGQP